MAYRNIVGLETGNLSEFFVVSGGAIAANSTIKRTGAYSIYMPTTQYAGIEGLADTGAPAAFNSAALYVTVYLYIETLQTGAVAQILSIDGAWAASTKVKVVLNTSGTLQLRYFNGSDAETDIGSPSAALSTGVWHRVEVSATATATAGAATAELKLNGTSVASATGLTMLSSQSNVSELGLMNAGGSAGSIYFDDIAISDSAYPGAGQVNILKPNGAGNYTAWAGTYADVDEVPHDSDTSYLASSTSGQAETVVLESAATGGVDGAIGTVKSVAIVCDEGGASAVQVRLRAGTTDNDTTSSDPGATYVLRGKLYDTNPADSAAWESADLDGMEVGVDNAASVAARCTALYAMVWCAGAAATVAPFRRTLLGVGV